MPLVFEDAFPLVFPNAFPGVEAYPVLLSARIVNDNELHLIFSEAVDGTGLPVLDFDGGAVTAEYTSGDGTTTRVFTLDRSIVPGEHGELTLDSADYTSADTGWELAIVNPYRISVSPAPGGEPTSGELYFELYSTNYFELISAELTDSLSTSVGTDAGGDAGDVSPEYCIVDPDGAYLVDPDGAFIVCPPTI